MKIYTLNCGKMRLMMTKIKANIRGDSGLSDSQLMRSQDLIYQKNQKALDELEQYGIMETRRRRYQANAKMPEAEGNRFGAGSPLGLEVRKLIQMIRQFKLSCCGVIVNKVPYRCHSCAKTSFFAEELDKEEQVIQMGSYSGDKKKETRPWGSFENLLDEEGYKVKKIVVNRDQRLSLQLHKHRSEYWHILSGVGEMQVGDCTWTVSAGSCVEIENLRYTGLQMRVIHL